MKKIKAKFAKLIYLIKKSLYFAWHRHHFLIPPSAMKKYIKSFIKILRRGGTSSNLIDNQKCYQEWLEKNNNHIEIKKFSYNPLLSVIIPVYNVKREYLVECLESILKQSYPNFEIILIDDNSSNIETLNTLKEYENNSKIKIKYRKTNGMISVASNDGIKLAKGEFLVLVDNDDKLDQNAFYYLVEALNKDKTLDFIYTDEDKMDIHGKYFEPHFKPDYSPDTLMGMNYICHLSCLRTSLVREVGGFRKEYDGSQDYDLFLRILDKTKKNYHVPRILYHWRETPSSTSLALGNKSYAYIAGKKALEDTLKRRKIEGEVLDNPTSSTYLIKYRHDNPKVSIIIPMKDKVNLTKVCIDSLYNKNTYQNFEIIIVDNNSTEEETLNYFNVLKKEHDNVKILTIKEEFNYSRLNNLAIKETTGDYILLLNNDTEVLDKDFLDYMVGYASRDHVGCVGLKLLYKDLKVQHAGVVLGYGGVAGHIFVTASNKDIGIFNRLSMPYDYSAVTAACLLVKKSKYLEVDGFDENLKVALNDVDFNLKMLKKGYYNVCLNNISLLHYESKSRGYEVTKEQIERFQKEQDYMKKKWGKELENDKYFSSNYF
ncbi:MAG: glycosyltransferase [Bacilli bacterium]